MWLGRNHWSDDRMYYPCALISHAAQHFKLKDLGDENYGAKTAGPDSELFPMVLLLDAADWQENNGYARFPGKQPAGPFWRLVRKHAPSQEQSVLAMVTNQEPHALISQRAAAHRGGDGLSQPPEKVYTPNVGKPPYGVSQKYGGRMDSNGGVGTTSRL